MNIEIREYKNTDLHEMTEIWNSVVNDGIAFPQEEPLTEKAAKEFFSAQSRCAVAVNSDSNEILGLYILHPNNVGRCGHISNASYAVKESSRGLHIGEKLVNDSIKNAALLGFKILQFNAVVKSNLHARHLYERIGFKMLGTIPNGFKLKNNEYSDICLYYIETEDI